MRIRRGFLSDSAFDDVVQFLTASGVFERRENHIISGPSVERLVSRVALIRNANLFERERNAIEALKTIRVTASMLEGW
jgi:hypothetical protein